MKQYKVLRKESTSQKVLSCAKDILGWEIHFSCKVFACCVGGPEFNTPYHKEKKEINALWWIPTERHSLPITQRFSVIFSAHNHAQFPLNHYPKDRVYNQFLHPCTARSHQHHGNPSHVTMTPCKTPEPWAGLPPVFPHCPPGLGMG